MWREWRIRELARLRSEWRGAALWALRITVTASASYLVGTLFFPGTHPLLAPLTAMLVVQVSPVSLLASGVDRVVAVVSGVSLAVAFAGVVPLTWWSLGVLIFVSLVVGQALHLRANLIEVAISGMLVLGVGALGVEAHAWQRIAETMVGAAVAVAANLVLPPRVPTADAGRAIERLADALSGLLRRAADALEEMAHEHRSVGPASDAWLGQARLITYDDVPRVGATLLQAEQGRRFNVRAVGTPDRGPGLRQGLESLEHTAVAIRSMFRALADAAADNAWMGDESGEDVLLGLVQVFRELAAAIDAFGAVVRSESGPPSELSSSDLRSLREAVDGLAEARARLEDLVTTDFKGELSELHVNVLSTVKRVQRELNLDQRVRRQLQLHRRVPARSALVRSKAGRSAGSAVPATSPDADTQPLPRADADGT
jgi:hypothetical protein